MNAAHNGYSAQPMFGGPVYFYRNLLYHVPAGGGAFKFNAIPAGILVYHNTLIAEQNCWRPVLQCSTFATICFSSRDTPNRGIMTWGNATENYSSDYNGFRPNPETSIAGSIHLACARVGKDSVRAESVLTGAALRHSLSCRRPPGRKTHGIEARLRHLRRPRSA